MSTPRTDLKDSGAHASIYDVAGNAGISVVTVSRVFNDYPHVSERMRQRVYAAAREVGYTPRLVSKRDVIAIIVGHLDNISAGDYKTRLIQYLIRAAARAQYLVEFIPHDSVDLATKNLVDGIIEVGLTQEEMDSLEELPNVPTVLINKRPKSSSWTMVASDHFEEGRVATEYLLKKGHRRIALILDELSGWGVENKRRGSEAALEKAAAGGPWVFSAQDNDPPGIARAIRETGCTACLNFTDNYGFAVLESFANKLGLSIPDDISVICLENEAISPFFNPPLTTIVQPLQEIAEGVIESIREVLDGRPAREERIFHSRLIERASVKTLPEVSR